jgi:acetoin utilization protein AcuC
MTQTAFIYTDAYGQYAYSHTHPLKPYRLKLTYELLRSYGLLALPTSRVVETRPAQRAELAWFHTPEYLDVLEAADAGVYRRDYGAYGLGPGDNPIFPGLYAWSQLCAGGTLQAARLVEAGAVDCAFHIAGGLHHGMPDRAAGFCYVNDPVIAILELVHKGYRVAYIDLDVHHGDGVQAAFYHTDRVLTISLHESGEYLFPGTGFAHEIGAGQGRGYAVNVPFPPGLDDALFVEGFRAIVPPLVEAFQPDFVFTQLGVDSFHDDPLAHGQVTTAGFTRVLCEIKTLARRWIATGGGGYNLPNVARAWTLAWGIMNGIEVPDALPAAATELLHASGYGGRWLRDAALPCHHTLREHQAAELHRVTTALKESVFPIHGIRG